MGIQLKGGNSGNKNRTNNMNSNAFGSVELEETPQMKELRMKREAEVAAAKEALAKKQEEQRLKALAFEQRDAAKRQREEEEQIKKDPKLAAEREKRLAAVRAEEEQRARFKAEEKAKIEAERRVQEKKMDQTEALIAAIRAQVEKEKAAKVAATQKEEEKKMKSGQSSSNNNSAKPHFRTISPEEMAKLEEKKRMKAAGITPTEEKKTEQEKPKAAPTGLDGLSGGISGGLGGLGGGPSLSNPNGNGPSLSNPTKGQETLSSTHGGGLGIDITAMEKSNISIGAEESTVALDTEKINAAVEKSKEPVKQDTPVKAPEPNNSVKVTRPHAPIPEPVQVVGGASTIIVDDGKSNWGDSGEQEEVSWVSSGAEPQRVQPQNENAKKDMFVDENGDVISVVPVRQRPVEENDVQSAYNIDFDDDDDDIMSFSASSDSAEKEEAARKAEEERKRAEEEARHQAAEAAQKAEAEARRAEEEKKRQAAAEAMKKAEEEQRRIREAEIKAREMEEARKKAEEEAKRKAEEEARRKAEEEAKRKAEEEARQRAEEEARRKAEEEARRKAEEEARRKAEEEAKRKAEEEARRKAEEEAKRKAEEEARQRAEEEARRKAEEEARQRAEEEARRKAEEEARQRAEEEARRKAEEEARRKAEEEARRKAEEARREAEEAMRRVDEEQRRIREAEIKAKELEEARKRAEEEALKKEEEAKRAEQAQSTASNSGYMLPVGAEQFLGKYLSVNAINDQIVNTIQYIGAHPEEPRNIVILGQYGFGTTTIAEDFARSFYAMGICKTKTIAKIKGGALNRANIGDAINKLQGGCLVIENAGIISNEKLEEIYQIVTNPNNDVIIIMTGQIETLSRVFKENVSISNQFKHLVQVHRITDMDVFEIAKNHATQLGYPCEPSAENHLRRRMQEVESGNLDRVLKIVDNAVSKAHNREMTSGDQDHRLVSADFE
ncbi:MAG: hypothetical protein MR029_08535 [Clostridium sp.]|nr:hypothetical protein [Clostridium sp.]